MKTRIKALSALACGLLLLGTGCQSMSHNEDPPPKTVDNVFNYDGIPAQEYYVGGGYAIRYIAKENGTLFMADDKAGRLLETICMQAGEKYETRYDIKDINTALKLYFVPATKF